MHTGMLWMRIAVCSRARLELRWKAHVKKSKQVVQGCGFPYESAEGKSPQK